MIIGTVCEGDGQKVGSSSLLRACHHVIARTMDSGMTIRQIRIYLLLSVHRALELDWESFMIIIILGIVVSLTLNAINPKISINTKNMSRFLSIRRMQKLFSPPCIPAASCRFGLLIAQRLESLLINNTLNIYNDMSGWYW